MKLSDDAERPVILDANAPGPVESDSWPTDVTFEDHEPAQGPDAHLEFEFDPACVPRPRWR